MESLPNCPHCGASPVPGKTENNYHYIECGKLNKCPEWPTTEPLPTPEEARTQWISLASPQPSTPGH